MRAAHIVAHGRVEVRDAELPPVGPGQVLVRMTHAAVCGSDIERVYGWSEPMSYPGPPGYPGHEGVGIVAESRAHWVPVGTRVLTLPAGTSALGFAEFQALDAAHVLPAPAELDSMELLMAQQLGTVLFALDRFWPRSRRPQGAVVHGIGPAGLHFVQVLKHRGFSPVLAVDRSDTRLCLGREFGADVVVDARNSPIVETVMEVTGGRGAGLVVEASGTDAGRVAAIESVAGDGIVGLYGLPETAGLVPLPFRTVFRRRASLIASVSAQEEPGLVSFRSAVGMLLDRTARSSAMVTHAFDLERIAEALALAASRGPGVGKVAVIFGTP